MHVYLSVLERFDEGTALAGARAHGFGPALTEQTRHRCLVRQAEHPSVLSVKRQETDINKPERLTAEKKFMKKKNSMLSQGLVIYTVC